MTQHNRSLAITQSKFLAQGKKRAVYAHPKNLDLVVKLPLNNQARSLNRQEYYVYQAVRYRDFAQWLNPTLELINRGSQIVQPRIRPWYSLDHTEQSLVKNQVLPVLSTKAAWVQELLGKWHIWGVNDLDLAVCFDYEHVTVDQALMISSQNWPR